MSFHSSTNGYFTSDDTRSDTTEIIEPSGFAPSLSTPTASPHLSYGTEASTPNTASTDCSTGHISTPETLTRRTHSDGRTGRLRRLNSNDSPMVSASGFGVAASPRIPSLISNWASPAPFNGSSRAHSDSFGDSKEANLPHFALPPARSGFNPKRQTEMTNQPASPYKGQPVLPSSASNYELGRPAPAGGIANVLSAARAAVNSPPRPVNTNEPRSGLRVDPLLSTTSANSATDSFSFMSPGPRATGQGMFSPLAPRPSGFPAGRQPTAMSLPAPPAFSVPTVCEDPFAPPAPTRSPYPPSVTHNSPSSEISSLPPHSPTHSTCSHGSSCHSPHSTASILSPTMIGRKFPGAASVDAVEMQKSAVCRRHLCCSKCRRPLRRGEASSAVNSPSPHFVAAPNDYGPSDFGVPAGAYTQLPLVSHDLYVIDQKVAGMRHPSLNKHKSSPNAGVSQPLARRPSHNSLPHAGSSVSSPEADCEPEYEKPEFIRVSSQPVGPHGYEHHHGKVAHMHPHAHPHPHPSPYHAPVSLVNKLPPADLLLPPPTSEIPGSVRPAYQATIVANQAATAFMQPPQPALPHAPGTPNPGGRKSVIPLESKRPHFEPASVGVFGSPFPAAPGGPMPASAPPAVAPQTPSADEGLGAGADDAALRDLISRFRNRDFEAGGESCLPR